MYLVNRSRLHSACGNEPPRRLEPHELEELRRANKVRTLALTPTPTLTPTLTLTPTITLPLPLPLTRCCTRRT